MSVFLKFGIPIIVKRFKHAKLTSNEGSFKYVAIQSVTHDSMQYC